MCIAPERKQSDIFVLKTVAFGLFCLTFLRIFYFRIISEFLNSRLSVYAFYKVHSDSLLARTLNLRVLANISGSTVSLVNVSYPQENMSVKCIPRLTPLLYKKIGGITGMPFFLIFSPKHRLWVLVRTGSSRLF